MEAELHDLKNKIRKKKNVCLVLKNLGCVKKFQYILTTSLPEPLEYSEILPRESVPVV